MYRESAPICIFICVISSVAFRISIRFEAIISFYGLRLLLGLRHCFMLGTSISASVSAMVTVVAPI